MKHYMLYVTEINGEYEYPSVAMFNAEDEDSAHDVAENLTLNFRGSATWEHEEGSTFAWNDDGCTGIRYQGFLEVPDLDYEVLKKYIITL